MLVGHSRHKLKGSWIATEEVLAHECTGLGFVGLVVTIGGSVHQIYKCAIVILRKKRIPLASPDNFDDVPTGSSKEGLKFLDDLAVTSYWAIKALQVGVDDKGQII